MVSGESVQRRCRGESVDCETASFNQRQRHHGRDQLSVLLVEAQTLQGRDWSGFVSQLNEAVMKTTRLLRTDVRGWNVVLGSVALFQRARTRNNEDFEFLGDGSNKFARRCFLVPEERYERTPRSRCCPP